MATATNETTLNQSGARVAQVNSEVNGIQNTLNDGQVLGWVDSSTTTLNTTLNFYKVVQNLIETFLSLLVKPFEQPCRVFSSSEAKWMCCEEYRRSRTMTCSHGGMPQATTSSPQDAKDATAPLFLLLSEAEMVTGTMRDPRRDRAESCQVVGSGTIRLPPLSMTLTL